MALHLQANDLHNCYQQCHTIIALSQLAGPCLQVGRRGSQSKRRLAAGCVGLASLPNELLLHVLSLAARPLSMWVPSS